MHPLHLHSTDDKQAKAPSRNASSRPITGKAARSVLASLSLALVSLAAMPAAAQSASKGSVAAGQPVHITDKARQLFRTGVTLLQDPDGARVEEAYQQFKAAYAESPSWKILGNLGVTAMKLERDGEAIWAFREYLEQGGDELGDGEREQFQRDLDTLTATAATVTLIGLPAGIRVTDVRIPNSGPEIRNYYQVPDDAPLVLRVRTGVHRFQARWDGQEQTREVQTRPGSTHEVAFESPEPEPPQREPLTAPEPTPPPTSMSTNDAGFWQSPVPMYVSLGVGAVGVGLGALFLVQRSSATSDADKKFEACLASQACTPSDQTAMEDLDEKAARKGTFSALSFGVGAVGVGAGVALLLLNGSSTERAVSAAGVTFHPYASVNELGLWGQF